MGKRIFGFSAIVFIGVLLLAAVNTNSLIMPVNQIKPGMAGYGLTVFKGTEPERFNVEVVDILKGALPKQDIILIKISGHGLEKSGIYQGMSGSPIFIDNKLIGALAYGWSYAKVALAGVTPIENMLAEMRRPLENHLPIAAAEDKSTSYFYGDGQFVPIASPVMVSGFPPSLMGELADIFKQYHLVPLQGGGGSEADQEPVKLKPGSALGVALVRGDINMSAIGTVTWVQGSRLVAFGHPFIQGGEVRLPITGAKILTLLPRLSVSTKMGIPTGEVGSLIQDRQSGVVGDLASKVSMIPFDIHVKNSRTGREESLHTEMAWVPGLSTKLISMVLYAGLVHAEATTGENTADCTVNVKFRGYPPVELKNTYFNNKGPFHKLMLLPLMKMIYNPFEKVEMESLKVSVNIHPEVRIALIKRLWMEEQKIPPGGVGKLHIVLAPFGSLEEERVFEIKISDNAPPGSRIMLGVAGGGVIMPPVAPPVDFNGVIRFFKSLYKFTDLVVVQQLPTTGAKVEGSYMPDLPPAAIRILGSSNSTGPLIRSDFKITPIHTNWVILGRAALRVYVSR